MSRSSMEPIWHAHVYIVALFHGQYYTYTSHKNQAWPPTKKKFVGRYIGLAKRITDILAGVELPFTMKARACGLRFCIIPKAWART